LAELDQALEALDAIARIRMAGRKEFEALEELV